MTTAAIRVVPANEATWEQLAAVFGTRGAAAVDHARDRGARALEAYPMRTEAGEITWDEIYVGAASIFAAAAMMEVSRPGKRRVEMRIEFPR